MRLCPLWILAVVGLPIATSCGGGRAPSLAPFADSGSYAGEGSPGGVGGANGGSGGTRPPTGGTGQGGKTTGGTDPGTGGVDPSTGGAHTGGSKTGGASNAGGSKTGGTSSTGGSKTGGASNTGGSKTGGASNTGGSKTGGASNTGGSGAGPTLPPIQGGLNGWASRYWDCCKPHCGWTANVPGGKPLSACDVNNQSLGGNYDAKNGCESGGQAFMCYGFAPWAASDTVSYGFAAFNGVACGTCFQIQFTGDSHNGGSDSGAAGIKDKQMVVQVINIGGIEASQFDLLIPGGGVGAMNGCSTQWSGAPLGAQYGGYLSECSGSNRGQCVLDKCQAAFGASGREDLMEGCRWFVEWFNAADNPNLVYKQTTCPEAITSKSGMRG
ncbi:MAG: hypothetical protein JW940_38340 [Polyangiaceae bacterium]|nr:hypothetical protein [Polyangiaceae bacterium]